MKEARAVFDGSERLMRGVVATSDRVVVFRADAAVFTSGSSTVHVCVSPMPSDPVSAEVP